MAPFRTRITVSSPIDVSVEMAASLGTCYVMTTQEGTVEEGHPVSQAGTRSFTKHAVS